DFIDHKVALTDRSLNEAAELAGFSAELVVRRFLPYTTKGHLPVSARLVRLYLRLPPAWWLLGPQTLFFRRRGLASRARTVGMATAIREESAATRARARNRVSTCVLLVSFMLVGAIVFYVAGRGLSFFFDEWSFILLRQQNTADAFLAAHN